MVFWQKLIQWSNTVSFGFYKNCLFSSVFPSRAVIHFPHLSAYRLRACLVLSSFPWGNTRIGDFTRCGFTKRMDFVLKSDNRRTASKSWFIKIMILFTETRVGGPRKQTCPKYQSHAFIFHLKLYYWFFMFEYSFYLTYEFKYIKL
jgi:hypothetical protein